MHNHPRPSQIPVLNHAEARDPVCGMTVDPATAAGSYEFAGATWYFCSLHCLEKFRAAPEKYAALEPPRPEPAPMASVQDVEYTCPMHPEIVRDRPGACP